MADCSNVKVGDFVALYAGNGWYRDISKAQVTRTTKAIIEVAGRAYNRHGDLRGSDSWLRDRIEPWDDATHSARVEESRIATRKRILANELNRMGWQNMELDKLERIYAAAKEDKPNVG